MNALIAGSLEPTRALAERLAAEGIGAQTSVPGATREPIPALAASLVELERRISAQRPGMVVLADRSDHALAAALVATKLLVPAALVRDGGDSGSGEDVPGAGENHRLLGLLAQPVEIDALPTLLRQ
ncbi:MAG: hypothetical protein ACRDK9_06165 [Solirubrobacterales bacterium]